VKQIPSSQLDGITDCTKCPVGFAAGVQHGARCPLTHRARPAGTYLYLQGQQPERVWFVKRGAVALSRTLADNVTDGVTWTVRRTGDYVGVEAFAAVPYADSARLVCDSVLCAADLPSFQRWMHARAENASSVLRCVVLAQTQDTPRRASADGRAVQRTAAWVLEENAHPSRVRLPRREVAQLLGMLPETLSRALASLAAKSAIDLTRRTIVVRDATLLESIATRDAFG
jgi:CRP-like cAMP-binding protein